MRNPFRRRNAATKTYTTAELTSLQTKCNDYVAAGDPFANYLVRRCIQVNALHTSKAAAKAFRVTGDGLVYDKENNRLADMLNNRPNPFMNGRDFLMKIRSLCELNGTAFIYIQKDFNGAPLGFFPIQASGFYALTDEETETRLKGFRFVVNGRHMDYPLSDIAVLRRDYAQDRFFGSSNANLQDLIRMQIITDKGLEKSIQLTTSLMGIIKETKAMLDITDVKKARDDFVRDYMGLNESGIAVLDSTRDYVPINIQPCTANIEQQRMYEKRIMLYFGTNEPILMNSFSDEQWTAYYEGSIEPFLIALSQELTNKVYSEREHGFGNQIFYEANRLQYASAQTKLGLVALLDRGSLTIDEYREILHLPPLPNGLGKVTLLRRDTEAIEGR